MEYKIVNGVKTPLSAEDIEQRNIDLEIVRLQKLKDSKTQYQRDRAEQYPVIGDQLDAILKQLNYWRMTNKEELIQPLDDIIGDWLEVKAKHPKPKRNNDGTK